MDKHEIVPLRKRFVIDLSTSDGVVLYRLRITQGSLGEYFDFETMTPPQKLIWLQKILDDHGVYVVGGLEVKYPDDSVKNEINKQISLNAQSFIAEIVGSIHKQRESLYKKITKRPEKGEKKRKGVIAACALMVVCQKWNITMNDLLDNYTLEQYQFMSDGIIFQDYETTDNGRQANDQIFSFQGLTKNQREIMDYYKKLEEKGVL